MICIWCRKSEEEVSFNNKAHIIPKSLGGKLICPAVCDSCNSYFGNYDNGSPPIEESINETFSISREVFFYAFQQLGKSRGPGKHFTSRYFDINLKQRSFKLKMAYNIKPGFQTNLSRQVIRGIYKMFLESTEYTYRNALDPKFDFIREFARNNIGDFPLFYFQRKYGAILVGLPFIQDPDINMDPETMSKSLVNHSDFFEFEFLGHVLSIARSKDWQKSFEQYATESVLAKKELFKGCIIVQRFDDIDFALSVLQG